MEDRVFSLPRRDLAKGLGLGATCHVCRVELTSGANAARLSLVVRRKDAGRMTYGAARRRRLGCDLQRVQLKNTVGRWTVDEGAIACAQEFLPSCGFFVSNEAFGTFERL